MLKKNYFILFCLSEFVLLFFGSNVLHVLGWNIDFYAAPAYQKIRPEFYILVVVLISALRKIRNNIEIKTLLFVFFVLIYWIFTGQTNGFAVLFNTICIPAILSLLLKYTNTTQKRIMFYILIAFFIVNSVIALFERTMSVQIFPYYAGGENHVMNDFIELTEFRSTALRNHPLGNALLTAVIIPFIIASNQIKVKYKFLLFALGFLAIMSFNARSSIMIVSGLTFLYLLYNVVCKKVVNISRSQIIIMIIFSAIVIVFFFSLGWGGRLLVEGNLQDSSVEARFLIYERFLSSDFSIFLFGMTNEEISKWAGLSHIESFWILYLCRFGIFIFIIFVCILYKLLKQWVLYWSKINTIYILLTFLLVSSTNNSIYSGDPAIAVFILSAATLGNIK